MIKGQRKQLHREILEDSTVQNTKKATVLVTNPTHRAIGLYYQNGITSLPIVAAKGKDELAKRMIEVARAEGIPIMENVPLAHALFDGVETHCYITSELIEPVAEILRWVKNLDTIDLYELTQTDDEETDGWIKI